MNQNDLDILFQNQTSINWIKLSIFSLVFLACYSIINNSQTNLIIHAELLFYISMMCITNSIMIIPLSKNLLFINKMLIYLASFFIVILILALLISDYNSVIKYNLEITENICFILSLSCFTCICFIISLLNLFSKFNGSLLDWVSKSFSIIFLTAFSCLIISFYYAVKVTYTYPIDNVHYYEMIFWGGRHVLQFLYITIFEFQFLVFFIISSYSINNKENNVSYRYKKAFKVFIFLNVIFVILNPILYFIYNIDSFYLYNFFSQNIRYFSLISPICIFILTIFYLYKNRCLYSKLFKLAFFSSVLLFLIANIIPIYLSDKTSIPSYYKHSIIGISITIIYIGAGLKILKYIKTQYKT
jgi:hypothetical protein